MNLLVAVVGMRLALFSSAAFPQATVHPKTVFVCERLYQV